MPWQRNIPRLGCWWHQQEPLVAAGAAHRLEAGMVLALEPYLDNWHIQDMILVTESAPVLLSAHFPTDAPFTVETVQTLGGLPAISLGGPTGQSTEKAG